MACPKPAPSLTPAFKALLRRHHSCTGQTKAAAWLRKLFLWASEGDVRQPTGPILKRSSAAGRPAAASLWPVRSLPLLFAHGPRPQTFLQAAAWPRKLFLWASKGDVRDPRAPPSNPPRQPAGCRGLSVWRVRSLPLLFAHRPRPQTFLQAAAWPRKLFLWASEGDVRDPRAPPSNPPRQPAGLPRPLCGLSEACPFSSPTGPARKRSCRPQLGPESFFYGLPKATLETHGPRPQTLLGSRQACRGLSVACPKPASSLRPPAPPANVPAGRSLAQKACSMGLPLLFAHGPRPQTFLQAAAWPRKLFLWASEGDVRDPWAPPSNAPRQPAGLPRPLCGLSEACLFSSPTGPARKRSCRPQLGPESFFYQLPKATLETRGPALKPSSAAGRPAAASLCGVSEACPFSSPTGPARKRSCRPQLGPESLFYGPASSLRPRAPPANVPAGRSLAQKAFSMGFRRRR